MSRPVQTISEGLLSDILNEHFGEAVELVGVALMRNGSLTLPELMRTLTVNLLGFPRDSVNAYNVFGPEDTVAVKTVRDALLVLVHFELVRWDEVSGKFSILFDQVLRRLSLAAYLELFEGARLEVMELVLKRGRVSLKDFSKEQKVAVHDLIGARFLKTVDAVTAKKEGGGASPKKTELKSARSKVSDVVVAPNMPELEFAVVKQKMIEFVRLIDENSVVIIERLLAACSVGTAGSFLQAVSVGELALADLIPEGQSQQQAVGGLIKLQGMNFIRKHSGMAAPVEAAVPAKKRARAANSKQLLDAIDDAKPAAGTDWNFGASPMYSVKLADIVEAIQTDIVSSMVRAKYGEDGHRVFQLLVQSGQKMEASHIADICAISREEALKFLHSFNRDNLCAAQEVPKISATAAAAGLSAVMRAVASSFWLYSVDFQVARNCLASLAMQSIINLRRRFRLEVVRQCKIEDRAAVLTTAQEEYLQRVHDAQDTLEASAINLTASLVFLLL